MASALRVVRFAGQGRAPSDLIPWTKSPRELLKVVFSCWILFPGSELERGVGGRVTAFRLPQTSMLLAGQDCGQSWILRASPNQAATLVSQVE